MNILYGVNGVGLGHYSRVSCIVDYLLKKGHKVKIFSHGNSYELLKDKYDVLKINGMDIIFENGVVNNKKTFIFNVKNFFKNILIIGKIKKIIQEFSPDICICDMELFTNFISLFHGIPVITIDNQHFLTNIQQNKFEDDFKFKVNQDAINFSSLFSRKNIILSFIKKEKNDRKSIFVSPVIRNEIKNIKKIKNEKLLVYISVHNQKILDLLKNVKENFYVYGYNKDFIDQNLIFRSKNYFLNDLKECKGIIGNAGFSLISEALYLKIPYFAIPVEGQYEQISNGIFLKNSNFGESNINPDLNDINNFLDNLKRYKKNLITQKLDYEMIYPVLDDILKDFNKQNFKIDYRDEIKKIKSIIKSAVLVNFKK